MSSPLRQLSSRFTGEDSVTYQSGELQTIDAELLAAWYGLPPHVRAWVRQLVLCLAVAWAEESSGVIPVSAPMLASVLPFPRR